MDNEYASGLNETLEHLRSWIERIHEEASADGYRKCGYVADCKLEDLWPAFSRKRLLAILDDQSVVFVTFPIEHRVYRVRDVDIALGNWFRTAAKAPATKVTGEASS